MIDPLANAAELWDVTKFSAWVEMPISALTTAAQQGSGSANLVGQLTSGGYTTTATDGTSGEVVQLDISAVVVDYGMNEIPQCTLNVALGRQATNTAVLSAMHYIIDSLSAIIPAKVYVQAQITAGQPFEDWPFGPFLIFDGLTTHSGFQTSFGQASLTITLSNWLVNLAFSSTLSKVASPLNPLATYYSATISSGNPAAGASDSPLSQLQNTIGVAAVVETDLWGYGAEEGALAGGIQQFLLDIAQNNRFNDQEIVALGDLCNPNNPLNVESEGKPDSNDTAISALNRFEPVVTNNTYVDGVPVALQAGADFTGVAQRIAADIGQQRCEEFFRFTFWDKLVGEYVPNYLLALVPLVEKALIVPFVGGLRQDGGVLSQTIIYARDFNGFEMSKTIPRPLRGIALLQERAMATGAAVSANGNTSVVYASGAYYDTCGDGVVVFKQGPPWLMNITLANFDTLFATLNSPIPTNQAADTVVGVDVNDELNAANQRLWRSYAQACYVNEVLRHRQARISGKVRFDTAPGSSVAVEVPTDRFVAAALNSGTDPDFLYGTAVRVTTTFDAESCKAGTAFQLAYLRNATEDTIDKYSVLSHPIWSDNWYGAKLVDT